MGESEFVKAVRAVLIGIEANEQDLRDGLLIIQEQLYLLVGYPERKPETETS